MTTPRLNLDTFDAGDPDWSHTDTVELFDELAVVTDTISNRPASGDYDGELFLSTDEGDGILYIWNQGGSSWEVIVDTDDLESQLDGKADNPLTETLNADNNDIDNIATAGATTVSVTGAVDNTGGDYNEAVETHATASGTTTLDLTDGNIHLVEAIDNVTLEVANVTGTPPGNSILIHLFDDDGGGDYTVSYGTSWNTINWDGGNVRDTVPATGNIRLSFTSYDGGTEWYAIRSGRDFA